MIKIEKQEAAKSAKSATNLVQLLTSKNFPIKAICATSPQGSGREQLEIVLFYYSQRETLGLLASARVKFMPNIKMLLSKESF